MTTNTTTALTPAFGHTTGQATGTPSEGSAVTLTSHAPARTSDLIDLDRRHLVHPHHTPARPERQVFVRGRGGWVWDEFGVRYLDMMGGGNWVAQVGHARAELVAAGAAQLGELEFFSCWREYVNEPAIRLAERLAALAPADLNRVFYTCGGSDGTDTAIKIARRYFYERGEPNRTWIIGRHFGYHGCTLGSGSVTGLADMQVGAGPTLPHIAKVSAPMPYRDEQYGDQNPTDVQLAELAEVIERIGAHNIAAMIGEPILGGAGVVAPPADYWPRVRALLREHGVILIADEVITAFGRTGHWFASADFGMDADLIITAKGLTSGYAPLGAVLMRDEIGDVLSNNDSFFFHGQTYYGHPVSCRIALANLDVLAEENLVERAGTLGQWFSDGLAPLMQIPIVGDVRVSGAMVGVELVEDQQTKTPLAMDRVLGIVDTLRERHRVLVRDYGPTLVIGPPLVAPRDDVDDACAALRHCIAEAA